MKQSVKKEPKKTIVVNRYKTTNTSMPEDTAAKIKRDIEKGFGSIDDEYFDFVSMKEKPVSERWIMNFAVELVDWAKNNPKAYKMSQFLGEKSIGFDVVERWRRKYPNFDSAYRMAMSFIGDRREIGALENRLNANMVSYKMPMYDPNWKQMVEWRESLKKPEEVSAASKVVYVIDTPIEECSEVKPLIKKSHEARDNDSVE